MGMEASVWSKMSPCWDGDVLLSTGVMAVGIGGGLSHGGCKAARKKWGGGGVKAWGLTPS